MTDTKLISQAWTSYWQHSHNMGTCLPESSGPLVATLNTVWDNLGKTIKQGSTILDLACGIGHVGLALLKIQPNFDITGVDYAKISSKAPFEILSNIDLSKLPFENNSFLHCVSQFGFEYSDMEKAASEVSRVTKPDGSLTFVMHHQGSKILKTNIDRYVCLNDLAKSDIWLAGKNKNIQNLQNSFDHLIGKFGETKLMMQIASAIRESLNLDPYQRDPYLDNLLTSIQQEMSIIENLEKASLSKGDISNLETYFNANWEFEKPKELSFENEPLAWVFHGKNRI